MRSMKDWLKRWSTSWTITTDDLTVLRDKFGEKVVSIKGTIHTSRVNNVYALNF